MTINCRVCGKDSSPIFSAIIFEKSVRYYECETCSYVQTEFPYWLERAYQSAINSCDTGIMARNQNNVGLVISTLSTIGNMQGCVVDCAAGYGILVRLLRDKGVEALWSDPYCKNLLAVGFEHSDEKADLVTAFEAFEHFVNPMIEAEKLFSLGENLLISTDLIPNPAPNPDRWWYYGLDHGQHIGFYRPRTLKFIADQFGKHLMSDGHSVHLFTDEPLSAVEWRMKNRLARRMPNFLARRLQPKTLSDFEMMSGAK